MSLKKQQAIIKIGSLIIDYDKYNFEWDFKDEKDKVIFLNLSIPNLTKDTRATLKKGLPVIFDFGFDENISTAVTGTINKIQINFSDVTNWTDIEVKAVPTTINDFIGYSYRNKPHSFIIRDVCSKLGLNILSLNLKKDKDNPTGYTVYGRGLKELKELIEDTGSAYRIDKDTIKIFDEDSDKKNNVQLINFETGLLEEPSKSEEDDDGFDYTVVSLSNPLVQRGDVLKIESSELKSFCKIVKMDVSDFVSTYYVKVMRIGA